MQASGLSSESTDVIERDFGKQSRCLSDDIASFENNLMDL